VTCFEDEPSITRIIWLFSLVLGHSRHLVARFVLHQDLQTLLRCHMAAFEAIGGVPIEILYDRMKTAVTDTDGDGHIIYNRSLLALAKHYGFHPRACRPYRAKTKGKVERPFSYIRKDFFLARSFRNLDDLNTQLQDWLDAVANVRLHATTQRIVSEAFAAEQLDLQRLPAMPFDALLKLERRVSHDGLVSIGGNYYSVPDRTRRIVEVHQLPDVIRILDGGRLVASHPVLEGRRQYRIDPGHRQGAAARSMRRGYEEAIPIGRRGDHVVRRSLAFYQAVGESLALGTTSTAGDRP
jgi:Integrase core domain